MRALVVLGLVLIAAAPARADWSAPVVLSEVARFSQGSQRAAGNAAGDAVVAWDRAGRIEIARRSAGGPFRTPERVGAGNDPELALNDAGQYAVVWGERTLHGVNGGRFSIGGSGCSLPVAGIALDNRGTATVLWRDCDRFLYADVARDGTVSTPQTLPVPLRGGLAIATAPDGTLVVTWIEAEVARVAVRPPGGMFELGEVAVGPELDTFHVAASRGGGAALAWAGLRGGLHAVVRPPAGTFGAPTAIAPTGRLRDVTLDDAGVATAIHSDTRSLWATTVGGAIEKIADADGCRVLAEVDVAGALYVAGDTDCGGAAIWGTLRPPGGRFPGKVRALGPLANNRPPSLVASGAGAVVAWPIGTSPPRARHVMTAVAFRAVPLIAFTSGPRVRGGRLRVRVSTPAAVDVIMRVVVGRRIVATVRRRVSGTRTLTVRRPRAARTARVVLTVRGGDEIARRVRLRD
jgi:hypothetical protein